MSICSVLENPQIHPSPTSVEGAGKDGLFLSSSPMMTRIHGYLERFASVNVPVLLLGESGVGSFGPVLRFAFGARYAAQTVTKALAKSLARGRALLPVPCAFSNAK